MTAKCRDCGQKRHVRPYTMHPQQSQWPDDGSYSGIAAMVGLVLFGIFAIVGLGAALAAAVR